MHAAVLALGRLRRGARVGLVMADRVILAPVGGCGLRARDGHQAFAWDREQVVECGEAIG
jgi:hypothetical protein